MEQPVVVVVNDQQPNLETTSNENETSLLMLSQQLTNLQAAMTQSIESLQTTTLTAITELSLKVETLLTEVEAMEMEEAEAEEAEETEVEEVEIIVPPTLPSDEEEEAPKIERENWLNRILFQ